MTKKILRDGSGYCRACYELKRNEAIVREIELNFPRVGAFNERIFRKILDHLGQLTIQRLDIRMLERMAHILNGEQLNQPGTWPEARLLSRRFGIVYSVQRKCTCPILRIAVELEKEGAIPHETYWERRYDHVMKRLAPEVRTLVEIHVAKLIGGRPLNSEPVKAALRILHFKKFLKEKDLLCADRRDAETYFQSFDPPLSVVVQSLILQQLRRFYSSCVERGLASENPFEGFRPESMLRTCERCKKTRYFRNLNHLCDNCYLVKNYWVGFDRIVQTYRDTSSYNRHLFDLYVQYVKCYRLTEHHLATTKSLIAYLESKPMPVIRSWSDIAAVSKDFADKQKRPIKRGCPFFKVGKTLQELGVLPNRQTDKEALIETLYKRCDPETAQMLRGYCKQLIKMKYAMGGRYGTIRFVFEFYHWLVVSQPDLGLFTVSEETAVIYLNQLQDGDRSGIRRQVLRKFYRWARSERITLMNPFEKIPVPKPSKGLEVCSEKQIKLIESFVKNTESNPEYALILALVLYWGLSGVELTMSTIDIIGSQIWIKLYRREISRRRKSHNREEVLKLPLQPTWLASLQIRYIKLWRERYDRATKSFPIQPLILCQSLRGRPNRHLSKHSLWTLFYDATLAATGEKIPSNVVRRTSGHIHTDHGDASRLMKLGWSKTYSNAFSSRPRSYFKATKK
jgi:hypothetical protein